MLQRALLVDAESECLGQIEDSVELLFGEHVDGEDALAGQVVWMLRMVMGVVQVAVVVVVRAAVGRRRRRDGTRRDALLLLLGFGVELRGRRRHGADGTHLGGRRAEARQRRADRHRAQFRQAQLAEHFAVELARLARVPREVVDVVATLAARPR